MSAAKSAMGTLDSQDFVLINKSCDTSSDGACPAMHERERAEALCRRVRNSWKGNLDGFIRMETGFEAIMCNAGDSLELLHQVRTSDDAGEHPKRDGEIDWLHAAASRYDGIGADRIHIDFESMVTAFHDYAPTDSRPRIGNGSLSKEQRLRLFTMVSLVATSGSASDTSTNWQAVTDLIVARYDAELLTLNNTSWAHLHQMQVAAETLMRPFIDYTSRSRADETTRCSSALVPIDPRGSSLPEQAVRTVAHRICDTLQDVLAAGSLLYARAMIAELVDWLDWPTWKRCGICEIGQFCFVPMWPHGSLEDWESPQCKTAEEAMEGRGYWGAPDGMPGPPPGGAGGDLPPRDVA